MGLRLLTAGLTALIGAGGPGILAGLVVPTPASAARSEAVTFTEHVAPIVFRSCLPCHRAGEAAPFELLRYEDVKKRARQIVEVTQSRSMPPWLPAPGHGTFDGDRRLSDEELAIFERWLAAGTPEGDPVRLPPVPAVTKGWQLGEPELVLTMTEPFVVPAEGTDVYRNFVLPIPAERARFVEALELRPGNKRVVHHAVVKVDRTASSRELDAADAEPGYGGMDMGLAESPDGQFLGWTPGRVPTRAAEGMAWTLKPGSDLVVQLHMVPSGKPEPVQVTVGLYFTDRPPARRATVLRLRNDELDIPAGERAYVAEDALTLSAPVSVTRIYPHAHYLARRIEAFAELPDGSRQDLLLIEDWDFNWQDEYQYVEPLRLPRGTRLRMRYTFDNSAENPRNPQQPPRRVLFGNRSSDEMATLTLQLVLESAEERGAVIEAAFRHRVECAPDVWTTRLNLGANLAEQGKFAEAAAELRAGLALEPRSFDLHMNLGAVLASLDRPEEARQSFQEALRLSPGNANVHTNLALLEAGLGRFEAAAQEYRLVLAANPRETRALRGLGLALLRLERADEARACFERALAADPRDHEANYQLGRLAFKAGRLEEATRYFRAGLELLPMPEAHSDLARVYEARGMKAEAEAERAAAQALGAKKRR